MRHGRFISTTLAAAAAIAISPAWAAAATITDDVSAGTTGADTWIVEPGELRLKPTTVSANFDGATPLAGWTTTPWNTGGAATASDGTVNVDGARFNTMDPPTQVTGIMEFRATFSGARLQHVGFGVDFDNTGAWAMFSTGSAATPGLYARTRTAPDGIYTNEEITDVAAGAHLYRIDWSAEDVKFFVDGVLKLTTPFAVTSAMRPVASDYESAISDPAPFGTGPAVVGLDWLGIAPFPDTGAFESRVFAATAARAEWETLTPAGSTGIAFETRTGATATPDTSWSTYQPLGAGNAIQSPFGRYIQYRATLTAPEPSTSPRLDSVALTYTLDTTAPVVTIDSVDVSDKSAMLSFSSADTDVVRFECSLDGGAFAACTSPRQFDDLAAGSHTASVRAVDDDGNTGTADSQVFTIADSGTPPPNGNGNGNHPPAGGGSTPDTSGPTVGITPGSVRASRRGTVKLGVTCPQGELSCKVNLRLKRHGKTVARVVARIDGGKTLEIKLPLRMAAQLKLAERGRLKVMAVARAEDAAGNSKRVQRRITLRPHSS